MRASRRAAEHVILEGMDRPFFAYILECADGSFYVGHTDDLDKRLSQHQGGFGCAWTASRLPVRLVWFQEFATREEARETEHRLKGWSRAKKAALVRGDFNLIRDLSRRARPFQQ
jgi:predicted GIY-YIG superfamily endonuclease